MNAHAISTELDIIYDQMANLVVQGRGASPEHREALRSQYEDCMQRQGELIVMAMDLLAFCEAETLRLREILGE